MSLSEKGLNWLKHVERLALMPYDDQTGKQISSWVKGATIGYGHLIPKHEWEKYRNGITEAEAEALLRKDLERFVEAVRLIPRKLAQHEFDALVILAYNIGVDAFKGSTVYKMVSDPKFRSSVYKDLEAAWKAWNKSQGKILNGLIKRRAAEWDMYSRGLYRHW